MNDPSASALGRTAQIRHWLKRIALMLLSSYVIYLIAGNVYLNTAVGPWSINRKPEKFTMHWGPALTWWPGEIVLWKLSMRGHVEQTAWTLQSTRAAGHVSLFRLLKKEVLVSRLHVNDVTGDVQSVEQRILSLPEQPGGWLLRFPSITSDSIRSGKIGQLQIETQGSAKVELTKRLRGGPAELGASTVHLQHLSLMQGGQSLLQDGELTVDFSMLPTTRTQAVGIQKLQRMQVEVIVDGAIPAIDVRQKLTGQPEIKTQPGQGRVQGTLALNQGAVTPGGMLSWQMPITMTDVDGKGHQGTLSAQFSADQDLHFKASMSPQADGVLMLDVDLHADGTQIPLTDFRAFFPRTSGKVSGQWQFSSLQWATALFVNVPWLTLEGAGRIEGDIELDHGVMTPGSQIEVPQANVRADILGQRVTGIGHAKAQLKLDAKAKVRSYVDITLTDYGVVALDDMKHFFVRGNNFRLHAESDSNLAKAKESLHIQAVFNKAQVPDLRLYNRFFPNGNLRFDGGSGSLSGDVTLDAAGYAGNGHIQIDANNAQLRVADVVMRGDMRFSLKLKRADLAQQRFDVSGSTLELEKISLVQVDGQRDDWWAKVNFPHALLDVDNKQVSLVQGALDTRIKDVGFLLDLFSKERDYPNWMLNLIDEGDAQANASVQWSGNDLILDEINARNDRFSLVGRLRIPQGGKPSGDLYARWGVLGAAVELREGQRQLHIVGAKRWYEAQPSYLD